MSPTTLHCRGVWETAYFQSGPLPNQIKLESRQQGGMGRGADMVRQPAEGWEHCVGTSDYYLMLSWFEDEGDFKRKKKTFDKIFTSILNVSFTISLKIKRANAFLRGGKIGNRCFGARLPLQMVSFQRLSFHGEGDRGTGRLGFAQNHQSGVQSKQLHGWCGCCGKLRENVGTRGSGACSGGGHPVFLITPPGGACWALGCPLLPSLSCYPHPSLGLPVDGRFSVSRLSALRAWLWRGILSASGWPPREPSFDLSCSVRQGRLCCGRRDCGIIHKRPDGPLEACLHSHLRMSQSGGHDARAVLGFGFLVLRVGTRGSQSPIVSNGRRRWLHSAWLMGEPESCVTMATYIQVWAPRCHGKASLGK